MSLAALVLVARVVDVQAVSASRYASYANSEMYEKVTLPAVRGALYDRAGNLLAASVSRVDVVADDYLVKNAHAAAEPLGRLLGVAPAAMTSELHEHSGYVVLDSEVGSALAAKVSALDLPFVTLAPETDSLMPDGGLFSSLFSIGPTGHGASGLEEQYRGLLSGVPGSEELAFGVGGTQLPTAARDVHPSQQGDGLVLTLDQALQYEVTNVLSAEISATKAASGVAVVMDTRTGGILAMVNLQRSKGGDVVPATQNLALETEYQPGSVMKLATISGALQEKLIKPNSELTVPDTIYVGGSPFQDAEFHPTEAMPVTQILAQSSNVGTIEIAHLLRPAGLYHYLRDLGFGQPTGLNWPGEIPGFVPKPGTSHWWGSSMGAVPIGTGEAVTPVQVLDAYNAVANGGMFVPPRLVQAKVTPGGTESVVPSAPRHRVLDASTVRELVPMLEQVTAAGTATLAEIPGYTVAGKTGTAQIPSPTGGYTSGWMATFVGFVPAQQPKLTAVVVLNHPDLIYGGSAAAPVFSTIMRYALRHFDISPPATKGATSSAGHS